jgi:hypothetical protein
MDSWGYTDTIMSYFILLWRSYNATVSSGVSMGLALAFGTAILLLLSGFFLIRQLLRLRKFRIKRLVRALKGKRMSAPDREQYEKDLISDGLTDVLEELYFLGRITKEKKDWWYKQFAQKLDLQGCANMTNASVKEQVKRRLKKDYGKVVEFPQKKEEPRLKRLAGNGKLFKRA